MTTCSNCCWRELRNSSPLRNYGHDDQENGPCQRHRDLPAAIAFELTKFRNPGLVAAEPAIAPPNTLGPPADHVRGRKPRRHRGARLRAHDAELVGEMVQYEDKYRLCYVRGPAGIIIVLAEELF